MYIPVVWARQGVPMFCPAFAQMPMILADEQLGFQICPYMDNILCIHFDLHHNCQPQRKYFLWAKAKENQVH